MSESAAPRLGREELAAALDVLPDAVAILDRDWIIRFLNPAAAALIRRNATDVVRGGRSARSAVATGTLGGRGWMVLDSMPAIRRGGRHHRPHRPDRAELQRPPRPPPWVVKRTLGWLLSYNASLCVTTAALTIPPWSGSPSP